MPGKRLKAPVSQAQRGAMFSAAAGKSQLGIPKKVGQEFAKADIARGPKKLPAVAKPAGFKPTGVVAKRQANNSSKGRLGLKNIVTDRDPMQKATDADYP